MWLWKLAKIVSLSFLLRFELTRIWAASSHDVTLKRSLFCLCFSRNDQGYKLATKKGHFTIIFRITIRSEETWFDISGARGAFGWAMEQFIVYRWIRFQVEDLVRDWNISNINDNFRAKRPPAFDTSVVGDIIAVAIYRWVLWNEVKTMRKLNKFMRIWLSNEKILQKY